MTSLVDDDGNYLDYSGDDFTLSKQAFSVLNFQIKGDSSVNFKMPNTSSNRKILGYHGPLEISSPVLSPIAFNLVRNGNEISKGFIAIQQITKAEIQCYFIAGNASWFNDFQFDIQEIDFTDFNGNAWSAVSVVNDAEAVGSLGQGQGITFPFVDWAYNRKKVYSQMTTIFYGDDGFTTGSIESTGSDFYPCFYLKNLVDYAFRKANYKLAGDILSDALYNQTVITPNDGNMPLPDAFINQSEIYASLKTTQAVTGGVMTTINLTFDQGIIALFDNVNHYCYSLGFYTYEWSLTISTSVSQTYLGTGFPSFSSASATTSLNLSGTRIGAGKGLPFDSTKIQGALGFNITSATLHVKIKKNIRPSEQITPLAIIPSMKAIELIKAVAIRFGCVVTFNEASKTVSLNRIDNISSTEDWSEFLVSYEYLYQDGFKNNYIRTEQPDDFKNYDLLNTTGYGEANLQTDYNVNQDKDLYKDPFAGAIDSVQSNTNRWCQPFIPMVNLEDQETFVILSVTPDGAYGNAKITGTDLAVDNYNIVRVLDTNSGIYTGYHLVISSSSTELVLNTPYLGPGTGYVYKQSMSLNSPGSRLLVVNSVYPVRNIGARGAFDIDTYGTALDRYTTCSYGYFSKPKTGRPIDVLKQSLSYGEINLNGYNDISLDNRYSRVKRALNGPIIRANFLLPESKLSSFNSDKLIYLTCKDFTGYFWVDRILNYKDSMTEVQVDLFNING